MKFVGPFLIALSIVVVLRLIVLSVPKLISVHKSGGFSIQDMRKCERTMKAGDYARYTGADIRQTAERLGVAMESYDTSTDIAKKVVRLLDENNDEWVETPDGAGKPSEYAQRWKASWEEYMAMAMLMPIGDIWNHILSGKTVNDLCEIYQLPENIVSRRVEEVQFLSEIRPR